MNFEPAVGGEVRKQRPAVIVSNDLANKHVNRVQVVPVTTTVDRLYSSRNLMNQDLDPSDSARTRRA